MPMFPGFVFALKASAWHLGTSALVAACAAVLVFIFWYPSPYDQLAMKHHAKHSIVLLQAWQALGGYDETGHSTRLELGRFF